MTDTTPLQDDLIKHQIMLQRLQNSQTENIKDYLVQLKKTALQQIRTGSTIDLKNKLRDTMKSLPNSAIASMADLAEYESKFSAKAFNKHLNTDVQPVHRDKLLKTLQTKNMDIGHNYKSGTNELTSTGTKRSLAVAYKQYGNRKADEISDLIQKGYKGKLSDVEIARNVTNLINGLHTAQAITLAHTSVNFSSNVGRLQTIEDSDELPDQYTWNATLENSCDDCQDNDGQIFDIGDDVPPLHYRCSCSTEPLQPTARSQEIETTNNQFNQNLDLVNGADDVGG